jgi:hypothetical protein
MEEIQTQARLVDPPASGFAARTVSTTLARAEIEEAIASGDYPARLMLDVARVEDEAGTAAIPYARVAVDWDEPTLERLLRRSEDDEVTLWFDAEALERAVEQDEVDAHGLRERAAVVAVAVAAVGAGAGSALAMTDGGGAPPSETAVSVVSDVASGGTGEPAAVTPFTTDVQSGGQGQAAGDALSRYVMNTGGDVATPATETPSFTTDIAAGGTGQPESDALSRYITNTGADTATPVAVSSFTTDVAAGGTGQPVATPASDEGWTPSPTEGAGIAAGVVLLISAAGFTVVRKRPRLEPRH